MACVRDCSPDIPVNRARPHRAWIDSPNASLGFFGCPFSGRGRMWKKAKWHVLSSFLDCINPTIPLGSVSLYDSRVLPRPLNLWKRTSFRLGKPASLGKIVDLMQPEPIRFACFPGIDLSSLRDGLSRLDPMRLRGPGMVSLGVERGHIGHGWVQDLVRPLAVLGGLSPGGSASGRTRARIGLATDPWHFLRSAMDGVAALRIQPPPRHCVTAGRPVPVGGAAAAVARERASAKPERTSTPRCPVRGLAGANKFNLACRPRHHLLHPSLERLSITRGRRREVVERPQGKV